MPLPLATGLQIGAGAIQGIIGAINARKRQKDLEGFIEKMPTYQANKGILDYYNQALARYNVAPTDTAMYKRSQQDINRGVAQGVGALQDRRAGIAGVSSILNRANQARLNANVAAENEVGRRFGQYGQAAQMQAGEMQRQFQSEQNKRDMQGNLKMQKAAAANQLVNTGLSNIFSGLNSWQQSNMVDKMYGDSGGSGKGTGFVDVPFSNRSSMISGTSARSIYGGRGLTPRKPNF